EAARRGRDGPKPEALKPPPTPSDNSARDLDAAPSPAPPPPRRARPATGDRPSVTDEGLRGFRDVIAETEALGDATAQGAKAARDVFAATPPSTNQSFD